MTSQPGVRDNQILMECVKIESNLECDIFPRHLNVLSKTKPEKTSFISINMSSA